MGYSSSDVLFQSVQCSKVVFWLVIWSMFFWPIWTIQMAQNHQFLPPASTQNPRFSIRSWLFFHHAAIPWPNRSRVRSPDLKPNRSPGAPVRPGPRPVFTGLSFWALPHLVHPFFARKGSKNQRRLGWTKSCKSMIMSSELFLIFLFWFLDLWPYQTIRKQVVSINKFQLGMPVDQHCGCRRLKVLAVPGGTC